EPEADADPDPDPDGEALSAMIRIDARRGFAFPAIDLAIDLLARRAVDTKLAGAAIRRSHHCGQLGAHVERLAERGLVALMAANAPKAIAPWGGARPFFGTNPIAFAAPIDDAPPLVIDLSISKVARGKVMAAAKAGEAIPEGWALDPTGAPTTDPNAALAGTMAPLGDAKGAARALRVEVLAATLTGANQSYQSSSFFDADGPPPGVGQLILAFDPAGALGGPGFGARMSALLAAMTAEEGVRPPGARRHAARERALREGVAISPRLKAEIDAISGGA
ncbi:MAG: Ldh family oxidoreductase, partial [Pseudomonadota bacterium]